MNQCESESVRNSINKRKKRKKIGMTGNHRRREKIQSMLLLLAQLVCILLLFVHAVKKYAPDTIQCSHSFNTTISDVKRVPVRYSMSVVFNTCEGKVFFSFDTGIGTNAGEVIDATIKELQYLSDNNVEVSIRIRNDPDNNPLSAHFKEYEMVALEDDQTQMDKFARNQKLGLAVFSILLTLWLMLAIAFYVIFR